MGYAINDRNIIQVLCDEVRLAVAKEREKLGDEYKDNLEHPLDKEILGEDEKGGWLKELLTETDNEIAYSKADNLDKLWSLLLKKAIVCLRYFDTREPFLEQPNRDITAYGLDKLEEYHRRYTDFESLMYGASSHYRDHVFHAFRVWMLGIFCLLKPLGSDGSQELLINQLELDGGANCPKEINWFEYISMWTIIALCHDLGYPLEKSQQILEKTRKMMEEFVPNPNIWNNFGYHGVQNNINEYILKFISTKLNKLPAPKKADGQEQAQEADRSECTYVGRIQPKYYLKYAKSLEDFRHGIVSVVIIYKMLLYFLESDFNLNDDYIYTQEDARQFYIRREILRAIASHTCSDAYNIRLETFSSLLFLCDELQEWGRRAWNELYTGLNGSPVSLEIKCFSREKVDIEETVNMKNIRNLDLVTENICRVFERQYSLYKTTFRDGQYIKKRAFSLKKTMKYELPDQGAKTRTIIIEYELPISSKSHFKVNLSDLKPEEKASCQKAIKKALKDMLYVKDLDFSC